MIPFESCSDTDTEREREEEEKIIPFRDMGTYLGAQGHFQKNWIWKSPSFVVVVWSVTNQTDPFE